MLCAVASIPTAAGREHAVIDWLEAWAQQRQDVELTRDALGNIVMQPVGACDASPIVFAAHLDHPAFVVEKRENADLVHAQFRGGVMTPYFKDARVVIHTSGGERPGAVVQTVADPDPHRACVLRADADVRFDAVAPGDIATWDLPAARIATNDAGDRLLDAPACDDLATVAAALCAYETLLETGTARQRNVQLLFTRAEEVGFVGAIGACKSGTIPPGARILALENSRSFADSPLGAGPIVRVGDRMSVFSPVLTASVAKVAQGLTEKADCAPGEAAREACEASKQRAFRFQRKLMAGGACEASAYCAFGYEATCVCLPLENYHNMGDVDAVESRVKSGATAVAAPIAPERIHVEDYHNLVTLLIACGETLDSAPPLVDRLTKMYEDRKGVLM